MEAKEVRLSIRMDQAELDKLKNFAKAQNQTLTAWVKTVLLQEADLCNDRLSNLERRITQLENKVA